MANILDCRPQIINFCGCASGAKQKVGDKAAINFAVSFSDTLKAK